MAVALSESAAKQVKELKKTQNLPETVFLRMGVKGGGCSGMSYALEFDSEIGPHDKQFEIDGIKIVVDKKYDEVLGMHMIGPRSTELIAEAVLALRLECTAEELIRTIHAHPTMSEAVGEAAHATHGAAIHM